MACIQRQASKGSRPESPTPEHKMFLQIFGGRGDPGMPAVADQVLLDFCAEFPDGVEARGAKRGHVNLAQYIHETGSKLAKRTVAAKYIYDRELFLAKMEQARKWTAARADEEWRRLEADPATHYDEGGPPWAKLRLRVPPWLLGEEREEDARENYEKKALASTSKVQRNMADDQKAAIIGETSMGFGEIAQPSSASRPTAETPAAAWTNERTNISSMGILAAAAAQCGAAAAAVTAATVAAPSEAGSALCASAAPGTPVPASAAGGLQPPPPGQSSPGAKKPFDLVAVRSSKLRAAEKDVADVRKKTLGKCFALAAKALDENGGFKAEAEYKELAARTQVLGAVLDIEPPAGDEAKWAPLAEALAAQDAKPPGDGNEDRLKTELAKQANLPIESARCLVTVATSRRKLHEIGGQSEPDAMDQIGREWDNQKILLRLLVVCVVTATKALVMLAREAAAAEAKEKKELEQQQKEAAGAAARAADKDGIAEIEGGLAAIGAAWHVHGQRRIPLHEVGQVSELKAPVDPNCPAIFKVDFDAGDIDKSFKVWLAQSTAYCRKKALKVTQAPATAAHGAACLATLFQAAVPSIAEPKPGFGNDALRKRLSESTWRTELPGFEDCGWQWLSLGLLRYQLHGVSELLAISGQAMAEAVPKLTGGRAGAAAFEKWLRNVSPFESGDLLQATQAGVELFCGRLPPGHLLLLPPGFCCAARTPPPPQGSETAATVAVVRNFLECGPNATKNMTASAETMTDLGRNKLLELLNCMAAPPPGGAPETASVKKEGLGPEEAQSGLESGRGLEDAAAEVRAAC